MAVQSRDTRTNSLTPHDNSELQCTVVYAFRTTLLGIVKPAEFEKNISLSAANKYLEFLLRQAARKTVRIISRKVLLTFATSLHDKTKSEKSKNVLSRNETPP